MSKIFVLLIGLIAIAAPDAASAETLKVAVAQRGFWNSTFIDVGWSVPPFVLQQQADGRLVIIARGSDVAALAQQTIRVNVANANALKERRDAFVRFIKALSRSIDWAYADPKAIDNYAEIAKVPRALAQQTRDDFFPKESLQLSEVKGLDVTLKQALEFKYITSPVTVADAQGMLDILYKPEPK